MTKFNQCPNCKKKPGSTVFGGSSKTIYECKACGTLYCHECGGRRCPDCGSEKQKEAGKCYSA